MGKESECKTMAIPVMLKEAADTGVITQSTEDALEHEKLKAQEEIEELIRLCKEDIISCAQKEVAIEEVEERLRQLLIGTDILT